MAKAEKLITDNLDLWSSAIKKKSSAGRGSKRKLELFGLQKLRRLILKLAIDGLLVKQDEREEPAFRQLERIEMQKATGIRAKRSNKNRIETEDQESKSDPLPSGWSNTTLDSLVTVLNGRAYKKDELLNSGTPVLRVGNLFTSSHWYYSDLELEDDKYCEYGDLIFAWSASFGPFIWDGPKAIFHYHIWKLLPYKEKDISKHFLFRVLEEKTEEIKNSGHGVAMIHMTKAKMERLIIRLPPLAEQHRIVAKVDELMALCDQLEEEQENNLETHETLVGTLLNALTSAAADASQFADAWQRIKDHFDILFTTEGSVDQLKQTILQLAVMGKLVKQNSNDEPVDILLGNIVEHKEKLIKEKRIKKTKALNAKEPHKTPFAIPSSWRWRHFESIANIASNLVKPDKFPEYPHLAPDNIEKGNGRLLTCRTVQKDKVRSPNHNFYPGQIIYSKIRPNLSKVVIVDFEGLCSADMYPIDPFIDARFLHKYMLSEAFVKQVVKSDTRVAMPKINQTELNQVLVPIPPLNEQHRIAAKVDELMTLCDQLKASISSAQETQLNLADSIVEQAIQSPA